jgi:AGCS family alanine or glycine:cation symporter
VQECVPAPRGAGGLYGAVLAAQVAAVVLGGIRRIALATEAIVPLMCGTYLLLALVILARHAPELPEACATILRGAFRPDAAYGGFLGVLVQGVRRAAFSNEAGIGSASIAHAAAKTDEPVREGIVALLEPFVDTVVVCTLTALLIVVTGAHANPDQRAALPYRLTTVAVTWLGSMVAATNAKDLSDSCLLAMSVPNLIGLYLLGPRVRRALDDYWSRFGPRAGGRVG